MNYKTVKLSALCEVITKGTTPRTGYIKKQDLGAVTFIRAENVDGLIVGKESFKYVSIETHLKELKRSILKKDDILVTIAGTLGRVAMVTDDILPANTNQAVSIVRVDSPSVNLKYIYYWLSNPLLMKPMITASSGQSVQPNFNLQQIGNIEINVPSIDIQNKIVDILSSIDNKINLNNQINDNLYV